MQPMHRFCALRILASALIFASALSCASTQYGGKQVTVTLSTLEQKQASTPEDQRKGANAYLLTFDQWASLGGRQRMAELERLRLDGKPDELAAGTKKLLAELAEYKRAALTPVEVLVGPRMYVFVASKDSQLRSVEFNPVRAKDGEVLVSFATAE